MASAWSSGVKCLPPGIGCSVVPRSAARRRPYWTFWNWSASPPPHAGGQAEAGQLVGDGDRVLDPQGGDLAHEAARGAVGHGVLPVHADRLQRPGPVVVPAVDQLDERGVESDLRQDRRTGAAWRMAFTLGMGQGS